MDLTGSENCDHGATDRVPTRVLRRALSVFLTILVVGVMASVLAVGIMVRSGHLSLAPVLSGSMHPAASAGDLALLWQVPTSSLKVGDVVSFYAPGDTTGPKMHRIVSLTTASSGAVTIATKGDANRIPDPWGKSTLRGSEAYRMVGVVPLIGWTASIARWWVAVLLFASGGLFGLAFLHEIRHKPANNTQPQSAAGGTS